MPTLRALLPLALAAVLGGCLTPPGQDDAETASFAPDAPATGPGEMTAGEESDATTDSLCVLDGGVSVPDPKPYCAVRTRAVSGTLTLLTLPVLVDLGSADVVVGGAKPGEWSLEIVTRARGATADEARAAVAQDDVAWSIGEPLARVLRVAQQPTQGLEGRFVDVRLLLPRETTIGLDLSTGSGDVDVSEVRASAVLIDVGSGDLSLARVDADAIRTTGGSGDVSLEAVASGVQVERGSGDVALKVAPRGSGAIMVDTGSGDVSLTVPEDAAHGYQVALSTGSGESAISLKDGRVEREDDEDVAFLTDGYASRAIRTAVTIDTGSGDASVAPR